jgi:hypothetical protein
MMIKDEEWMKNCRVWMYRGAWAEWEMDHVEMAVPISPEELRFKRNSILKHQSQMESAPFLGNDERLFWQRAEDRNRATAELVQSSWVLHLTKRSKPLFSTYHYDNKPTNLPCWASNYTCKAPPLIIKGWSFFSFIKIVLLFPLIDLSLLLSLCLP